MAANLTSSGPTGGVSFLVHNPGAQDNILGGVQTILFPTEIFDIGGNFASNTFTAPVAGSYQLSYLLYLSQVDTDSAYYEAVIRTSNMNYYTTIDPGVLASDPVYWNLGGSMLCDMDASDTAYITLNTGGGGAAQVDAVAGGTRFSGVLIA
jgi:hypothetical protein